VVTAVSLLELGIWMIQHEAASLGATIPFVSGTSRSLTGMTSSPLEVSAMSVDPVIILNGGFDRNRFALKQRRIIAVLFDGLHSAPIQTDCG
jgi:hypothetical protein